MCLITALATALGTTTTAIWSAVAATTSIIATATSTALGAVSSAQQGNAAKAQAEYQAQVARNNAKIAQNNADMKRQEGIEEARTQRLKTIQKIGSQQAAMAANGFDVGSGTNLDVIEDTASMGELDALTVQYNKETQALAYEQQAGNFNNQANLDMLEGQNAQKAGMMGAVGKGLNGLASISGTVSDKWFTNDSVGKINTKNKLSGGYDNDVYSLGGYKLYS